VAAAPLRPSPFSSIAHNPNVLVSAIPQERRYFYLYSQESAAILSGLFPSEFWSRLVPQTGYSSPPIRYALTSVTALIKVVENTRRSPLQIDNQNQTDSQYQFAIAQYSKAISALRHLLSTKASNLRVTLTACLLFACIETLLGNITGASYQIIGGFKLLAEAYQGQNVKRIDSQSTRAKKILPPIGYEMTNMFTNLEVQCNLPQFFSEAPIQYQLPSILSSLSHFRIPAVPASFQTLPSAKTCLDSILKYILLFHYRSNPSLDRKSTTSAELRDLLSRWKHSFAPLMEQAIVQKTERHGRISAFILASNHAVARIIVATDSGRCSEMFYDTLTSDFQYITDCSDFVINTMCSPEQHPSRPAQRYVFGGGLLPPLYVVASKCRHPRLRRLAIALLRKCPIQEGIWEGYGCARICEWMMEIEESGMGDIATVASREERNELRSEDFGMNDIPEWNRVKLNASVCKLHEKMIWAQCKSALPVMQGSNAMWEKTFTW
jgi:hypothetical protein